MFKNVLVGVDGTPGGRDAIALAQRLLDPDAGQLTLVHVHPGENHPLHAVTPGLLQEELAASQQLLERERAGSGVEAAQLVSISSASPGAGLHRRAEEQDADLIVVGSSHRGPIGRVMLGDNARQSLNGAPCAVAIASRRYAEHPKPFADVGVGYNDSAESHAALAKAREVAEPTRAALHVLEVIAIPTYSYVGPVAPFGSDGGLETLLDEAEKHLKELPGVQARATYGLTGEELAAFGDEVDLLVVGSRSYGPLKRLVLGSTSDYLERHARCCLLVLPRSAAAALEQAERAESRAGAAT